MSHTMNIKTEIKDFYALELACLRLNLKMQQGVFSLYASKETGVGVFLPGWKYPVVIKQDGTLAYDNYKENWGKIEELNKLIAYYGLEKAKLEAQKRGLSTMESYNEKTKKIELRILL